MDTLHYFLFGAARRPGRQALQVILLLFALSVIIRLPGLFRPLSKHHEFIPSVILINLQSWRQAGGASTLHYTPVFNFQNPGDLHPQLNKDPNIDSLGNQIYLSLPPGWYILPYAFFQLLHLPALPICLRLLNLLLHLITLLTLFFFLDRFLPADLPRRYTNITIGCILFLFSPGPLWYFGNGYVHTAIMLPVILALLTLLLPMFETPGNITGRRLLLLFLAGITLTYLDWFSVFLCFSAALPSLLRSFKNKRYAALTSVLVLSPLTGIVLVLGQFASQAGISKVIMYWKYRFLSRSFANPEDSTVHNLLSLAGHLVTAYLPLLLFIGTCLLLLKVKKIPVLLSRTEWLFAGIYSCATLLYVLVLMDWAKEHEFSVLPASLLLAWLGARLFTPRARMNPYILSAAFLILSVSQYYWINRPGRISRDGMPYDTYATFGDHVRRIPPDYMIFANLPENCPMIEYYAKRNIVMVPDSIYALHLIKEWKLSKAVWITNDGFHFLRTSTLSPTIDPPSKPFPNNQPEPIPSQ